MTCKQKRKALVKALMKMRDARNALEAVGANRGVLNGVIEEYELHSITAFDRREYTGYCAELLEVAANVADLHYHALALGIHKPDASKKDVRRAKNTLMGASVAVGKALRALIEETGN